MHAFKVKADGVYGLRQTPGNGRPRRVVWVRVKCIGKPTRADGLLLFPVVLMDHAGVQNRPPQWVRAADLTPWGGVEKTPAPEPPTDYVRHVTRDALKTLRSVAHRVETMPEAGEVRVTLKPWQVGVIVKALALDEATNRNAAP